MYYFMFFFDFDRVYSDGNICVKVGLLGSRIKDEGRSILEVLVMEFVIYVMVVECIVEFRK